MPEKRHVITIYPESILVPAIQKTQFPGGLFHPLPFFTIGSTIYLCLLLTWIISIFPTLSILLCQTLNKYPLYSLLPLILLTVPHPAEERLSFYSQHPRNSHTLSPSHPCIYHHLLSAYTDLTGIFKHCIFRRQYQKKSAAHS